MNTKIGILLDQWLRYRLRIAVTVLCLFAGGLLTKLWLSSYYAPASLPNVLPVTSWNGKIWIGPIGGAVPAFTIPHWPGILVLAALAALPWISRRSIIRSIIRTPRYSIRALLIVTALIAVLCAAIAVIRTKLSSE